MPNLNAGSRTSVSVPIGSTLVLGASPGGNGSVVRMGADGQPGSPVAYSGASVVFGPYDDVALFKLETLAGIMPYAVGNYSPSASNQYARRYTKTVFSGRTTSVTVPAGSKLSIAAHAGGSGYLVPAGEFSPLTTYSGGALEIGPFKTLRVYNVVCTVGPMVISTAWSTTGNLIARNNLIVGIGDSREPSFTDPATKYQKGGASILNVVCARAMQRYRLADSFGQSGKRVDEFLGALPAAIAVGGGIMWCPSILNSLFANDPALANPQYIIGLMTDAAKQAIAAGYIFVVGSEIGQVGMIQSRIDGQRTYNAAMMQLAQTLQGFVHIDITGAVCDANGVVRADMTYDNTHLNGKGTMAAAPIVNAVFDIITPGGATFELDGAGLPLIGGYTNLAPNPNFAVATGGTTSTGATGTFAGSTKFNKTGAGSALAVVSNANDVTMTGTFTAQGDNVRCSQEASLAAFTFGDIVRGMAKFNVTNATGLAGVQMTLVPTIDSVARTWSDLGATATWAGPDGSFTLLALTQDYAIPAGSVKNSLACTVQATANGAGGLTLKPQQIGILKKI